MPYNYKGIKPFFHIPRKDGGKAKANATSGGTTNVPPQKAATVQPQVQPRQKRGGKAVFIAVLATIITAAGLVIPNPLQRALLERDASPPPSSTLRVVD